MLLITYYGTQNGLTSLKHNEAERKRKKPKVSQE
jgi:hypothetical protein